MRASSIDFALLQHYRQSSQVVEWRERKVIAKEWLFTGVLILQRIQMEKGDSRSGKYLVCGTVVAFAKPDENEGTVVQVVFDDNSAPKK